MKKSLIALGVLAFFQTLTIIGLAASFKVVMIILLCIIALVFLCVPTYAFYYIFEKYKQLRTTYVSVVQFLMLIQQQLKAIDIMQITDLRIVNLKQKIRSTRQFLSKQKERLKQNERL